MFEKQMFVEPTKIRAKPGSGAGLTPELKAWLDRVVVPALVREYLAEHGPQKALAPERRLVAECASTTVPAEGVE